MTTARPAQRSLRGLLDPASIALVGASPRSRVGRAIVENLLHLGYAGAIYPVNPLYEEVAGVRCYPSVGEVPGPIDAAMIATSTERVVPILRECGEKGVRGAVVTADGFLRRRHGGGTLQDQLAATARRYDMAVCGPNCMGVFNGASGGALYTGVLSRPVGRGSVSGVFQTGSLTISFLNNDRDLRCRYLISSGNEAVVSAGDYVSYLAEDPGTRVIAVALEGMRDAEGFLGAVERASVLGKRIVLLKLGVSRIGRELSAGHTGALAGSGDTWRSICRQYGIAQVRDVEEMFTTCLLLSRTKRPRRNRAGAITLSGGYATLAADLGEAAGLRFPAWSPQTRSALAGSPKPRRPPRNPFDAWGVGDYREGLARSITAALADRATDFVVVMQDLPPDGAPNGVDVPDACVDIVGELGPGSAKPIVVLGSLADPPARRYRERLAQAGSTYLPGAEVGMRALAHWSSSSPRPGGRRAASIRRRDPGLRLERHDVHVLRDYGIPVAEQVVCRSEADVRQAAISLGCPVVLKVDSPDLPHRTDVDGVKLGVREEDLAESYRELMAGVHARAPGAHIEGVIVQRQAAPGLEMIVGAVREPDWGWMVMLGLGGIHAETLRDNSFRRVPIGRREARAMLEELRSWPLLRGSRRQPARDVDGLARMIVAVAGLVRDCDEDTLQVEFNPVLVRAAGEGLTAVDTLVLRRRSGS